MKQSVTTQTVVVLSEWTKFYVLIAFLGLEYVFQPVSGLLGDRKSSLTKTDGLKYFV
jgi:hypothetical protein